MIVLIVPVILGDACGERNFIGSLMHFLNHFEDKK